jgi:CheY-like chemotaxis protein
MTDTKAHPLDLLKIIRDRIEGQEGSVIRNGSSFNDKANSYGESSLFAEDEFIGEVLIVDDDPDTLYTINEIVKTCKCKTLLARSGKECLQILNSSSPALILLDIMMPEMDGFQTLKQIKQIKKSREIAVFAVTARAMAEDKEVILRYGFDDYISKPVNSGVMAFKIEKLFSKLKIA